MSGSTPVFRPRVLQVGKFYSPEKGGMETHLMELVGQLRETVDIKVLVANRLRWSETQYVDNIPVYRAGSWFTIARTPICPAMLRSFREDSADVIHLHWPNPWALISYLASNHPGKLVISYHSDIVRQRLLGSAFEPLLHRALERSAAIIVSSSRYLRSSPVLKKWEHRCRVIPYGFDASRLLVKTPKEEDEIHRRFGTRIVLGVGRMVYYKGFEYLVRAMGHVDGTLLLIGSGPLKSQLMKEAAKLPSSARVHFLGNVADLVPFYRAARVFVLPSIARSEAFGLVQLEAMAAGTPVINTNLDSGVPTVSLHNVTGLTVPPGDERAMAHAITRLLDDEALRLRFGEAARSRVEQEFTPSRMTKAILDTYAEVLLHSRSPLTLLA